MEMAINPSIYILNAYQGLFYNTVGVHAAPVHHQNKICILLALEFRVESAWGVIVQWGELMLQPLVIQAPLVQRPRSRYSVVWVKEGAYPTTDLWLAFMKTYSDTVLFEVS